MIGPADVPGSHQINVENIRANQHCASMELYSCFQEPDFGNTVTCGSHAVFGGFDSSLLKTLDPAEDANNRSCQLHSRGSQNEKNDQPVMTISNFARISPFQVRSLALSPTLYREQKILVIEGGLEHISSSLGPTVGDLWKTCSEVY